MLLTNIDGRLVEIFKLPPPIEKPEPQMQDVAGQVYFDFQQ